ncbi:OLC1v1031803C1 [Oldenlandia corymbosa var. corymbosa]|uniref:OLC1v1031803C1 n=1 Tax=Oldenlandia corymbosa var. corymbosa TaxID=529605 RepID=A0AAV1CM81_OLDCO|nr:OLC1v1031803C1 [Oldenlandia corymbosa var. corymbosa]
MECWKIVCLSSAFPILLILFRHRFRIFDDKVGFHPTTPPIELMNDDDEASTCPICMDNWTTGGEHRPCCVPCGHIYGLSCIQTWLNRRGSCPQCNRSYKTEDIRVLFAARIVALDDQRDLREKIQSLESKCAAYLDDQQELQGRIRTHLRDRKELQEKIGKLEAECDAHEDHQQELRDKIRTLESALDDQEGLQERIRYAEWFSTEKEWLKREQEWFMKEKDWEKKEGDLQKQLKNLGTITQFILWSWLRSEEAHKRDMDSTLYFDGEESQSRFSIRWILRKWRFCSS